MRTYTGKQNVAPGLYLDLKRRTIVHLDKEEALPGEAGDRFYRVPMLVMLAAAPLLGLAFVIFLPLVGFVMMARLVGDKLRHAINRAFALAVRIVRERHAR